MRFIIPQLEMRQFQTVETVLRERILEDITGPILWGLFWMFLLSLLMGWFLAGRTLRPINRIREVAENIQAQDLTRRINLSGPDDELTRLAGTFDAMLDRLSGSFRLQQQFLASTSHDLRNPLAVIRSNLEVSLADPDSTVDDWRETGVVVSRAARRMSEMIDRLLEAARLEVGFAKISEVDLADLLVSTAQATEPLAEERGHAGGGGHPSHARVGRRACPWSESWRTFSTMPSRPPRRTAFSSSPVVRGTDGRG